MMNKFLKLTGILLILSMLMGLPAFASASGEASDDIPTVIARLSGQWTEAALEEIEEAAGLTLVIPDGVEYTASYMTGAAQASWTWEGVEVTERVIRCGSVPAMDSETLAALSGVSLDGLTTQSKELTVGGRCPGFMEFCRGSLGAAMWYDAEPGLIYTLTLDSVSDPKYLGDTAEWITPLESDAQQTTMIVIDGCAIAHDLSAVPVEEIEDTSDFLWKVVDGYGITFTDEDGVVWGIYRAGQAGVFEIVVSSEDDPSPWTVEEQIWVGGSQIVELCVEDGRLTHVLTGELQSGPAFDVELLEQ